MVGVLAPEPGHLVLHINVFQADRPVGQGVHHQKARLKVETSPYDRVFSIFNGISKSLNYSMRARPESSLVMAWRGQSNDQSAAARLVPLPLE